MLPEDVKTHPKWGAAGTHCVLCTRPFATDAEAKRHEGKQCDRGYDGESPCWCESYCWVTWGGECVAELDFDPVSEIVAPLRIEVERLRDAIEQHRDEARGIAQSSTTPVHPVDERLWAHLTERP